MIRCLAALLCLVSFAVSPAVAETLIEPPYWAEAVEAGDLPPVAERVTDTPLVVTLDGERSVGTYGGDWQMLVNRVKDTRLLVVFGYARLIVYNTDLELVPDILESFEVEDGRIFTFHLRPNHHWSNGDPFTAEDFRYWWQDVATHPDLSPAGPPKILTVDDELPVFEVIDELTVRYTWSKPNPDFLPALASAAPLFIYRPAEYMKQYHPDYGDIDWINAQVDEAGKSSWASLHNGMDNLYKFDNPELPTLQPWMITNAAPAQRFIGVRNPFFHKVDQAGHQLPYIDRVIMNVVDSKLIPLKTWAGESDLQARGLSFNDYTFLKEGEGHNSYQVRLWRTVRGSQLALYPNLNVNDPVWRDLLRDVRFRRALSLAVNRHEINQVIYYGLGIEGNNTVLPLSPLYDEAYRSQWANFDLAEANRLLDEIGLTERDSQGYRLLPDGRPLQIIVETAGEDPQESDILELIHDSWRDAGIKLFTKPMQREVLRNRVFAGETVMSIWFGLENGVPTPKMTPAEFAPTSQQLLQWPKWGQYYETSGASGEPIDMADAERLMELAHRWQGAGSEAEQEQIWEEILETYADGVFSIGLIAGIFQPVVVSDRLHNVPEEAMFNWDPGSQFGIYEPETFWFTDGSNGR
ncbi:MAG: ABC transporter substrate-binding protein [Pseudomonadota bacterium]